MNYPMILYILGSILKAEALLMCLPAAVALIYGEGDLQSFLLTIALAGIGGALEVLGNYHCLYTDFSPGFGYDGIPIALLCGSNPILAVVGSIAFGALRNGSLTMQARVGISNEIISVIQGSLILFVASNYIFRYLLGRRRRKERTNG